MNGLGFTKVIWFVTLSLCLEVFCMAVWFTVMWFFRPVWLIWAIFTNFTVMLFMRLEVAFGLKQFMCFFSFLHFIIYIFLVWIIIFLIFLIMPILLVYVFNDSFAYLTNTLRVHIVRIIREQKLFHCWFYFEHIFFGTCLQTFVI